MNASRHIAVILGADCKGDNALEQEVVFWVEAARVQMREHIGPAWESWAPAPGIFYYSATDGFPSEAVGSVVIVRNAGVDGAAGYHQNMGLMSIGVVDLSRAPIPSRTLSHEVGEMHRNAYLDEWYTKPDGMEVAAEIGDPVQRVQYTVHAEVLGRGRDVIVSDFVTPAYFDPGATGPRSHVRAVSEAFEISPGGYQICRKDGQILYLPAQGEGVHAATVTRPLSRTAQIAAGIRVPRPRPRAAG